MPSNQNNTVDFASNHPPAQQNQQQTNFTTETNPSSIGTQTENSFSKNSLEQKISSLGKEIKSLRKQNQLNGGIIRLGVIGLVVYAIATNWSAIASAFSTAGTATAAASPVIGIVIGAIIGAAVLVGASYAAWRYRAEIKAGFKYAAEKTVEGAKDLYGRAKKVVNSVTYYDHDHQNAFLKKMAEFTPENNKNYEEIREQLKVISNEKDGNVLLKNILSEIGSTIDSKIADKEKLANTDLPKAADKSVPGVNKPAGTDKSEVTDKLVPANINQSGADESLLSEWKMQREFIKELNSKSLKGLVNDKTGFPKDHYLITKIFSEHHSEIKDVIARCEKDHILQGLRATRSNMFYGDEKPKKPFSLPSFLSLGRKSSEQPNNLSRSSSMSSLNSMRTNSTDGSTVGLLTGKHKEVKTPTPLNKVENRFLSLFKRGKQSEQTSKIKYQPLPKLDSTPFATVNPNGHRKNSSSRLRDGSPVLIPVVPPKAPNDRFLRNQVLIGEYLEEEERKKQGLSTPHSNSSDSGRDSPDSGFVTPTGKQSPPVNKRQNLSPDDLSEARRKLRKTGSSNKPLEQPSTRVFGQEYMPVNLSYRKTTV